MHTAAPGEDEGAEITQRMRGRVDVWFARIDPEVRTALVEILKAEAETGGRAPSKAVSSVKAADIDPELDEPAETVFEDSGLEM
jgi:hypothetical protein